MLSNIERRDLNRKLIEISRVSREVLLEEVQVVENKKTIKILLIFLLVLLSGFFVILLVDNFKIIAVILENVMKV